MEGSITFGLDLVGGWSEILVKDKESVRTRVSFDEYVGKKKGGDVNRQWLSQPGTMIRKVALVGGLREAFPDVFGGLYSEEEFPNAPDVGPLPSEMKLPEDEKRPENVDEDGVILDAEFKEKPEEPGEDTPEKRPIQRRSPRHAIKDGDETIKTCGVGEIHYSTVKSAYLRDPALMKTIDKYLRDNGIKNITHLRQDEGVDLVNILMRIEAEVERAAGARESDDKPPKGEDDREVSTEEKSQGEAKEEPETSKKGDRTEMIPCPDRGEMEIEFAFCQDSCPKYDQKTCIHFADSPEEAIL
jgi:hypothetical protein